MKNITLLIVALFITSSISAQIIDIPDANFKNALVNTNCVDTDDNGWADADADTNDDGEIDVNEALAVTFLSVPNKNIESLEGIEYFTNLTYFNCLLNQMSEIPMASLSNLETLSCGRNPLNSLDPTSLINLKELFCDETGLTTLNLYGLILLEHVECSTNQLTTIDLTGLNNLTYLEMNYNLLDSQEDIIGLNNSLNALEIKGNELTSLDISATNITYLDCSNNQLSSLIFGSSTEPFIVDANDNQITEIDLSGIPNLDELTISNNLLTSFDISNNTGISILSASNNQISSLYMKDGWQFYVWDTYSHFDFWNNPISYVCGDDNELSAIRYWLTTTIEVDNYTVNSYCSFVPGGDYYTVEGNTKNDLDSNGCDVTDNGLPNLNFSVTNGIVSGNFISDASGNYNIPVPEGTHTITPTLENPSYFTISPTEITLSFPADASPFIQDFCVTPNGVFNDLEITIIPVELARPGFDTGYKVIYKNNGNTTLSGNINFSFEDDLMEFLLSTPANESGVTDLLQWPFTDLVPFESREIELTMNLNAPTETPPLNDGDILTFNASIASSETDETPDDNTFELHQTVVNSFDPNDKTCLEGDSITPEMVGDYVHYIIRFENTGSAEALNIVVKDHIDITKYDLSTLVPLHASHDYFARIKDNATEHYVEFIFEDINLPFNDANNDGYIVFKIKTLDTLVLEDTIENEAEIYFDFNFPIITNVAETTVQLLSIEDFEQASSISIYPNPVQDELNFNSKISIERISIYDVSGRLIQQINIIGNKTKFSIATKNLNTGVYLITVETEQNAFTTKLVKK